MGNLCAVNLALLQYLFGMNLFRKPVADSNGPLLASGIVLFSIVALLLRFQLYPTPFRKLHKTRLIIEYLVASFAIEMLMTDFWFATEATMLVGLPTLSNHLESKLLEHNKRCERFCDIMRNELTGLVCSYFLSFMILIGTLHAIRAIDLSLLEKGIPVFYEDAERRLNRKLFRFKRNTFQLLENFWIIKNKNEDDSMMETDNFLFISPVKRKSEDFSPLSHHFYTGS